MRLSDTRIRQGVIITDTRKVFLVERRNVGSIRLRPLWPWGTKDKSFTQYFYAADLDNYYLLPFIQRGGKWFLLGMEGGCKVRRLKVSGRVVRRRMALFVSQLWLNERGMNARWTRRNEHLVYELHEALEEARQSLKDMAGIRI